MAQFRRSRGLALIAVLWMVSLLTVLATSMLSITRANAKMSSRSAQFVAAKVVADSAIRLILARGSGLAIDAFSTRRQLEVFDQAVDVRIEREAGRIDLNAAEASLLSAAFVAGGIDGATADTFASRIIDWRDADVEPVAGGAEAPDYAHAKLDYGPRNGPFESVGELQQLLGLSELNPSILDAFTVYSTRSPTISRENAHPLVQTALDLQVSGPAHNDTSTASSVQQLIGQAVRIHACTEVSDMTLCRVAIVRIMNGVPAFLTHAWYTEK